LILSLSDAACGLAGEEPDPVAAGVCAPLKIKDTRFV
jgi:hypothetical protein